MVEYANTYLPFTLKLPGVDYTMRYFYNVKLTRYIYPDVSVTIIDSIERIAEVETKSTSHPTTRGIKIGDSKTKVKELYGGESNLSPSRFGMPRLEYH
jgi:hypothetical protein